MAGWRSLKVHGQCGLEVQYISVPLFNNTLQCNYFQSSSKGHLIKILPFTCCIYILFTDPITDSFSIMEWGPPLSKGNKGPGTGIIPTFSTKATDKSFVPFTGTSTTKIRYQWKFTPEAAQKTKLLRAAWIAVMSRNENNAVHVTDILIRSVHYLFLQRDNKTHQS